MARYFEYTTLDDLRHSGEGAQLNIGSNTADPFLLSLIREVSADIEQIANRKFAPYMTTQGYDVPRGVSAGRGLRLDDDLLEVSTLTNGDGTVVAAANILIYPANVYPKNEVRLKASSGLAWQPDSNGDREQVILLAGVFGYHDDYTGHAWGGGGTLAAQIGSTTAVAVALSAGANVEAGHLLKIDGEYLYASGVAGTTATIERAVNGSLAAVHTTGTAVDYWRPIFTVQRVTRMAAAALWNLRSNPEGKQVSVNGVTFTTPNSILEWASNELNTAGLSRTVTG